jgi:steroid delta-isomerase-like uncharacterized protein
MGQNKEILRRYMTALDDQDFATLRSLIDDNYLFHGFGVELRGVDAFDRFNHSFLDAFSDAKFPIEQLVAEGDTCVLRYRMIGTHTGTFMGVPATGKKIDVSAQCVSRLHNDKLVESWEEADIVGLLQQIGGAATEQNKETLRRWYGALNVGRASALAILDEVVTSDYRMYDPSGDLNGIQAVREFVGSLFGGMPDMKITLDEMVGEGDREAYRYTITGTHAGDFMGFAASGKRIHTVVTSIARFAGGKVAEEWQTWDFQGFLQQLSSTEAGRALAEAHV